MENGRFSIVEISVPLKLTYGFNVILYKFPCVDGQVSQYNMETDYKFIRKNKYIKMDRNGWHIDRRCLVPLLPVPPKNDIKWILERDK